jgi:hypothetical protein
VDREPKTGESILQRWVGNWVELHYAASSAEITPHGGMVPGPSETRVGTYLIEAIGDWGIEVFVPDPDGTRSLFVPWNSVLLIRGPSREELARSEQTGKDGPPRDRRELMNRLAGAQTSAEEATAAIAAADDWLAVHPGDGDVRAARDRLREAYPPDDEALEEGSPT